MKNIVKLGCVSVIILIISLVFLAAIVGGQDQDFSSSGGQASVEDAPAIYQLGDRFVLGEYGYTVHGIRLRQTIGDPEYFGEEAGAGAGFVVVEYTIENLTNESQTVLADDFKLIDAQERKFSTSSDATIALAQEGGQDFILTELQPGLPHRTKTAFKVPSNAQYGSLRLVIPEKGFFSSGEVIVILK